MEIKFFKPSPLFLLYNSETWTLTYTKEKLIGAFHRGLLRISINVRYSKIIKSTKLYTLTQQTPLTDRIRTRRRLSSGSYTQTTPRHPSAEVHSVLSYSTQTTSWQACTYMDRPCVKGPAEHF